MAPATRVLVVEDNQAFAENLEEILGAAGYAVLRAASCASALEAARHGFEVALVDLRLPDGDGTEVAAQLKSTSPGGEIVMLTGFATLETAAAAVRSGAFAYLVKPCETQHLLLTIEQALRQVRLHAEKSELARRAQVSEKLAAVGTLMAGLSHEIRNPLNAAGLQLSVLERRIRKLAGVPQAPLLEPLSLVQDEIQRLEHVLEDFLQFARPRDLKARPVQIEGVVARVLDLLEGEAHRRGVAIERRLERLPAVKGDADRLQQVLMNLCLNGIEAMPGGGRLDVSAAVADGEVIVSVEDEGHGVPADVQRRMFEPFFTTKASGSGLGLPIVHAIVQQHGGTIRAENRDPKGARFEVRLPIG